MKVYTVEWDEGFLGGYGHTLYCICKTRELAEKKMFDEAFTWYKIRSVEYAKDHGFEVIEWEVNEEE